MNFKKLALVAAVAAAPMSAMALEPMQDEALSGVTGQDGINIGIETNALNMDVLVHDKDGYTGASLAGDSGAIVITDLGVDTKGNEIELDIDADGNGGTAPVLNVAVSIPTGTTINTGAISVSDSDRDSGTWGKVGSESDTILKNTEITLGSTDLNIQLGNEAQGSMIVLDTVMNGGLTMTDGGILDAANNGHTGGSTGDIGILFDELVISDNGSGNTDLTIGASVDVEHDGLIVTVDKFGQGSGVDLQIENQRLGAESTNPIGDVEIVGLDLTDTKIRVSGH